MKLDLQQEVGRMIAGARVRLGMSQRQLATLTRLSRDEIRRLENGELHLTRGIVFKLTSRQIFTVEEENRVWEIVDDVCAPRSVRRYRRGISRQRPIILKKVVFRAR